MPAPKRVYTRRVWARRDLERAFDELPDAMERGGAASEGRWQDVQV